MIASFPPVAAADARLLILGSIPGRESLRQRQYYAHPRNAFWPIIAEVFGAASDLPYDERLRLLTDHGIALWDVIGNCRRPTSLDSDIEPESICFNGGTAEATFRRRILPFLDLGQQPLTFHRLPSTSPANAGCSYAEKLARWRRALMT